MSSILLPKDLSAFARSASERKETASQLLADGRSFVERVERLVCAMFEVPDDLTEEVVQHAVRRAEGVAAR